MTAQNNAGQTAQTTTEASAQPQVQGQPAQTEKQAEDAMMNKVAGYTVAVLKGLGIAALIGGGYYFGMKRGTRQGFQNGFDKGLASYEANAGLSHDAQASGTAG